MLRKKIFGKRNDHFRVRRTDPHRIELFSDAIFAFSVSLLIMSLEVPQTFHELKLVLQSFLPFIATVLLVVLFWREQERYFSHYGFSDSLVVWLNVILLVVILFYVYPLKFLFSLLLSMVTHTNYFPKAGDETIIDANDFPQLVMIYSLGYAVIWLLFFILYAIAWRRRKQLRLNHYEIADTKKEIRSSFFNCGVGLVSLLFAAVNAPGIGGLCFLLIPAGLWFIGRKMKQELKSPKRDEALRS